MAELGTLNLRITIGGRHVAFWRIKTLAFVARALRVPVAVVRPRKRRVAA